MKGRDPDFFVPMAPNDSGPLPWKIQFAILARALLLALQFPHSLVASFFAAACDLGVDMC